MRIFPAIDLYKGCAVRLLHGDYEKLTVYSENPLSVARDFEKQGAKFIHMVDLEGARDGETPNIGVITQIAAETSLFCEVGGGIRTEETAEAYLNGGVARVILGTAAVTDEGFLVRMVEKYGEKIAVGVDMRDGAVAIKGWTETTALSCFDFCERMQKIGVRTIICTDISKDGAMRGTNRALYRALSQRLQIDIVASGGVSTLDDIKALRRQELYGAIIGRAYYDGAISLKEALEAAE